MKIKNICTILAAALSLTACNSMDTVSMTYTPNPAQVIHAQSDASAGVGTVTDSRKRQGNVLGAIRSGFGNPLETLQTEQPVSEVVRKALADGLKDAGLPVTALPKYMLNVNIVRFDCNQYARREAHIELAVTLVNTTSGQAVYTKTIKSDKVTGSIITLDASIFASVDDLRVVANDVLQDAINQLLADPEFSSKFH